jgi:hypothetical protein
MENPSVSVSGDTSSHHGYITNNAFTAIVNYTDFDEFEIADNVELQPQLTLKILIILELLSIREMRKFYLLKHNLKEGKNIYV